MAGTMVIAPMPMPTMTRPMANARCRTNQWFINVIRGTHPPSPWPMDNSTKASRNHQKFWVNAKKDECPREGEEPDHHHSAGPESVGQVPFQHAKEPALNPGHGQRQTKLKAGPVRECRLYGNHPHRVGVEHRHGGDGHDHPGDDGEPPAVENARRSHNRRLSGAGFVAANGNSVFPPRVPMRIN